MFKEFTLQNIWKSDMPVENGRRFKFKSAVWGPKFSPNPNSRRNSSPTSEILKWPIIVWFFGHLPDKQITQLWVTPVVVFGQRQKRKFIIVVYLQILRAKYLTSIWQNKWGFARLNTRRPRSNEVDLVWTSAAKWTSLSLDARQGAFTGKFQSCRITTTNLPPFKRRNLAWLFKEISSRR